MRSLFNFIALVCLCLAIAGRYSAARAQDFSNIPPILEEYAPLAGPLHVALIDTASIEYQYGATDTSGFVYTMTTRQVIYSASKWLMAATIMSLVQEGKMSLDDKVKKYLPNFTGAKGEATLRQLLSHTSGFQGNPSYAWNPNNTLKMVCDSAAVKDTLLYAPGQGFNYGGLSMEIAGRLAELAGGEAWDSLFYKRIAHPCYMDSTDFGKLPNPRLSAGALSTVADYAQFVRMMLNYGRLDSVQVLDSATVVEMQIDQRRNLPVYDNPYAMADGWKNMGYGLGLWVQEKYVGTNQGKVIHSQGINGVTPWVDYCQGQAGVLFANSFALFPLACYDEIRKEVGRRVPNLCDETSSVAAPNSQLSFNLYPNPARSSVRVTGLDGTGEIRLLDAIGRQALTQTYDQQETVLNLENLPAGLYTVLSQGNGRVCAKKLVVE